MPFMYWKEAFPHTSVMISSETRMSRKPATRRTIPSRSRFIDAKETTRTLGRHRCAQYPAEFARHERPVHRVYRWHRRTHPAVPHEEVSRNKHILGIADHRDVPRLFRVRQQLPIEMRLDNS